MAQEFSVKGMFINDILNISNEEFNKLNTKDMRLVVGRLVSAENKRIRRLQAKGVVTPALAGLERSGGMFSTKGKNLNQLRAEYTRAKAFHEAKTSSIRGYNEFKKEFENKTGIKYENLKGLDKDEESKFWRLIERIKEYDPAFYQQYYREMWDKANEINSTEGLTFEDKVTSVFDYVNELYEEKQVSYDYEEWTDL